MNNQTSAAQGAIQKQGASVTLVQAIGLLREEKHSINQELAALPAVQWLEARGRELANREQELHITIDVLGRMFQGRAVGNAADACDAAQELEQFIEQVGDVHFQRCRIGSKDGNIRWDIEFGHYDAEVRGKTLRDAITKAIAAQAKQGEPKP